MQDTPYKPQSSTLKPQPKILKAMATSKGSSPISENLKNILAQKCSSDVKAKPPVKVPIHGNAKVQTSGITPKKALLTVSPARAVSTFKKDLPQGQAKGSSAKPMTKVSPAKPGQDASARPTDPRVAAKKPAASAPDLSAAASASKVKTPVQGSASSSAKAAPSETKKGVAQDTASPKAAPKAVKKDAAQDTAQAQQQKYELRKTPTTSLAKGNMRCVQCGRERAISLARSTKFCTQRCTVQWVEANPPKTTEGADVQYTGSDKASESPKAPLPRALKNLQIDMAKPGTKLYRSSSSPSSDSDSQNSPVQLEPDGTNNAITAVRSNIIENLTTLIAQQQQSIITNSVAASSAPVAPGTVVSATNGLLQKTAPGPKASGTVDAKIPAKGVVKRSTAATHAPAAKKPKLAMKSAAQSSQKSVSFNLNETPEIAAGGAPSSSTNPVLDRIASYLLPKKTEVAKIKLPPGEFCIVGRFQHDWNLSASYVVIL